MRTRGLALIGILTFALTGCADTGGEPVDCETVGQAVLDGLTAGTDLTPVQGAALAMPGADSYVVAIEVEVTDVDGTEVGVWETLSLDSGPYRSVDGIAQEFTSWPTSDLTTGDEVVDQVKSCLE